MDQVGEALLAIPEAINNGGISNEAVPIIIGKTTASSNIIIIINGASYTAIADSEGIWTLNLKTQIPPVLLDEGKVSIVVTNGVETVSFDYTVDTQIATPILSLAEDSGSADFITNNGQINVSNIETGTTWFYSIKGSEWQLGQGTSFNINNDGDYAVGDIKVQVIDQAGNIKEVTYDHVLTIDTNPPLPLSPVLANDTGIVADNITRDGRVEIDGIEADAKVYIKIKSGGWLLVTPDSNGKYFYNLNEGTYAKGEVQVKQVDVAGNESVVYELSEITVDKTISPLNVAIQDTGIIDAAGTTLTTNNPTVTITNFEQNAKVYYKITNGSWIEITTKDVNGNFIVNLPAGNYTSPTNSVEFKQIDVAGNESSLSSLSNFIIDTTTESVVITGLLDHLNNNENVPSGALINKNSFSLSGTAEAGSSIEISINGVVINTGVSVVADSTGKWSFNLSGANYSLFDNGKLLDGNYTITAKSTDAAGNISTSSNGYLVNVDTVIQTPTLNKVTGDDSISSAEYLSGITLTGTAEVGSTVHVEWRNTVSKDGLGFRPNISASFLSDTQIKVFSDNVGDKITITVGSATYDGVIGSDKFFIFNLPQPYAGNVKIDVIHTIALTNYNTTVTISNLDFTTTADLNGNWSTPITGLPIIPDQESNANINIWSKDQAGNISDSIDRTVPILRNESATINVIADDDMVNANEWTSLQDNFIVTGTIGDKNLLSNLYLFVQDANGKDVNVGLGPANYVTVKITGTTWTAILNSQNIKAKLLDGTYTFVWLCCTKA